MLTHCTAPSRWVPPACSPGLAVAFGEGMLAGNVHFLFRVAASLQLSRYLCGRPEAPAAGQHGRRGCRGRGQEGLYLRTPSRQLICW